MVRSLKLNIRYVPEGLSTGLSWYSTDLSRPGWFYSGPATGDVIDPSVAILSIDSVLKPLHKHLWSRGYSTIPSCSGHNLSQSYYDELYKRTVRECYLAKYHGIDVLDCVSGSVKKWHDPGLKFPWANQDAFRKEASFNSHCSRFGLYAPESTVSLIRSIPICGSNSTVDVTGPLALLKFDINVHSESRRFTLIEDISTVIMQMT